MTDINTIKPYDRNPRIISEDAISKVKESLENFGWQQPIVVDKDNVIIVGHTRYRAAQELHLDKVPVVTADLSQEKVKAYRIADNKVGEISSWDDALLNLELINLKELGVDLDMAGFDIMEADDIINGDPYDSDPSRAKNMFQNFLVPPFSILDARKGYWQDRKKFWTEQIGINSGEGRDKDLLFTNAKVSLRGKDTSIFDPVLCEILVKWFSTINDVVLDPFAGGSVRGIVASLYNREYIGVDLSKRQVEANIEQSERIIKDTTPPLWIVGDSSEIDTLVTKKANMVLSCPPYHDLENYTDNKDDLSNKNWEEFNTIYRKIIHKTCDLLEDDSFACWVIGEIRNKEGNYKSFVPKTIEYFEECGVYYYNEMILATSVGSLPLRASRSFKTVRKIGKSHQNVLIFIKGDIKRIMKRLGDIPLPSMDDYNDDEN